MGEGCYHICPNSNAYYSPERERQDDMMNDGSDDIRERYASTALDPEYEAYCDEQAAAEFAADSCRGPVCDRCDREAKVTFGEYEIGQPHRYCYRHAVEAQMNINRMAEQMTAEAIFESYAASVEAGTARIAD